MNSRVECRLLCPELTEELATFFERLIASGGDRFFHPHPLTLDEAQRRTHYAGRDLYCVLLTGSEVVGYGMLRGWDEGFVVPSLGIALDSAYRGRGYGRLLMEFLHVAARDRGATRVRLKVHEDNVPALELYRSLGYVFAPPENGELIGILELNR